MNVTYAINVKDLRVVSATCETLKQPDYRKITEETAIAIEKGKITAKEVVMDILFGNRKEALPADVKKVNNVRQNQFPKEDEGGKDTEDEGGEQQPPPADEPPADDTPPPEGSTTPVVIVDPAKELEGKNLSELKVIAASKGIKGFNKMDMETITKAILGA